MPESVERYSPVVGDEVLAFDVAKIAFDDDHALRK